MGFASRRWFMAACVALAALGGCARSARSAADARLARDPERQVSWLPAGSVAVAHVDMHAIRATPWYKSLRPMIPPVTAEGFARTRMARIALQPAGDDLWATFVLDGDYKVPPTSWLMGDAQAQKRSHDGHAVFMSGASSCFQTPERLWVCTEDELVGELVVPPESRAAHLTAKGWARPPDEETYLTVQARIPAEVRERAISSIQQEMVDAGTLVFGAAVRALESLSLSVSEHRGGIEVQAVLAFDSESAARSATGLLVLIQSALLSRGSDEVFDPTLRRFIEGVDLSSSGHSVQLTSFIDAAHARALASNFAHSMREHAYEAAEANIGDL